MTKRDTIKDFYKKIIGYVDTDTITGVKTVRTFGMKIVGYYDPKTNITFGCWYLNYLSKMFRGDPVCVISAYHAGQGQVQTWLSNREISPDGITIPLNNLPDGPTKKYAEKVTRDYGIYQEKHYSPASADSDGGIDSF